jgi:hypothetical protein
MTPLAERRTISFILRLWVEPTATYGQPRWQGQIEHVGSGQTTHFQVPAAFLDFLKDCLPLPPDAESKKPTASSSLE